MKRSKKQQSHGPLFPSPSSSLYYQARGMPKGIPSIPRERENDNN
jgi:hypothetical protein